MTQTAIQTLVFGAGNCVTWLDPSVVSSLTAPLTPNYVTAITDLATAKTFTYGLQSAPLSSVSSIPTLDQTGLIEPALILSSGFLWTAPTSLVDSYGQFTLFYVAGYDPHQRTEENTWLINSQPSGAADNYLPSSLPVTSTGGGILLKKIAGAANQFSLTLYDANGHSATSPVFTVVNNVFLLSVQVELGSNNISPIVIVQLDGANLWTYDPDQSNPSSLSFIGQQFSAIGVGASMSGLKQTGEVIVFQGPVSSTNVTAISNYLMGKWAPALPVVTIGTLSSTQSPVSSAFSATIAITNAEVVSLSTVASNTGSGWTAIPPSSGNVWTIEGNFPASITNFILVVQATDATGAETVSKSFLMTTTTLAGTLTSLQQQIQSYNPALWLDPSETTTLTTVNGRVTSILDRATSSVFDVVSSETPTIDTTSFTVAGLAFAKPTESSSGFNYGLKLDPTSRPDLFTIDPTIFLSAVSGGQQMGNGIVVTAGDGSYTLIVILNYNGEVSGNPAVDLTITNDFPTTALNYCTQIWKVSSTNQGSTGAIITVSDSVNDTFPLNTGLPAACDIQYTPNPVVPVGQASIITWRFDPDNGPIIRVNGQTVTSLFAQGSADYWSSGFQRITQIFGAHSLGSIGEIVAFPQALLESDLTTLEGNLIAKWLGGSGIAPTISDISKTSQYATVPYSATVTIGGNGTSNTLASIAASAGSDWTISQDPNNPNLFHISGVMPADTVPVSLTIYAEQDNATTTVVQTVQTTPLPTTPVIGMLSQLTGATSALFTATVTILNVVGLAGTSGLSISATQGTGWTIAPDSSGTPNLYRVTGTLPSVVTELTLTITAMDQSIVPGATTTAQRSFILQTLGNPTVQATVFALDLTGSLPANLITNEPQVLTPANGPNNQYFLPVNAPFYGASLVLQYLPSGSLNWLTAQPGSDFVPVGELQQLARATATPVFVGVTVLNQAISGRLRITYQTLGGNFVFDRQGLMTQLASMLVNQRQISWAQVVNLPMFFPVGPHTHNADTDIVGLSALVISVNLALTNLTNNSQPQDFLDMVAHMVNQANPHLVAPVQIGLGNVPNYAPSTPAQAVDPTNTTTLLTPYSAALAAYSGVGQATATTPGLVQLNEGTTAGDDTDALSGLTAAGLLALINATGANAIKTAFVSGEQVVQISPYPMTFPLYWQGIQYSSLNAFIIGVQTAVHVESLPFNQITGTLFFPQNVTAPSLVTSTTSTAAGSRDLTTEDPMSYPMLVPTGNW